VGEEAHAPNRRRDRDLPVRAAPGHESINHRLATDARVEVSALRLVNSQRTPVKLICGQRFFISV